jgi:acetyl-CoA synthetase
MEASAVGWPRGRRPVDGWAGGSGLNMAYEAVDRHAEGALRDKVAIRFLDRGGRRQDVTFGFLAEESSRFANRLDLLGVRRGERVSVLTGRIPALYVAVLGALKHNNVVCPLSPRLGPDPIRQRLARSDTRVLVTTEHLYWKKVAQVVGTLPELTYVIVVDGGSHRVGRITVMNFDKALVGMDPTFEIGPTDPCRPALLHFTSGTTGPPKGVVHAHQALLAHCATAATALDLRDDDVFWCTADPGWVTGMSYGILAPLALGATSVVTHDDVGIEQWGQILGEERINVWYTTPTALRLLMHSGEDIRERFDLSALRFVATVGEPLGAQAVEWGSRSLGQPIHDTWWQTETGCIMIANYPSLEIRPGSMGKPLPGVEVAILTRDINGVTVQDGRVEEVARPGAVGELALRSPWPSMFLSYLGDEESYAQRFAAGWYLSGDLVRRDADGYLWFVARADDVINSAGHLVGPSEVENALLKHPAVLEAGVFGKPDPVAGELVKAVVTLRPGYRPSEDLRLELIGWARTRLGPALAPKELGFEERLPHTTSGKVMRKLLKRREVESDRSRPRAESRPK